jgi:transposase
MSIVEVSRETLEALVERCAALLSAEDHALLVALVTSFLLAVDLLRKGRASLRRLRRLFGLRGSEKTQDLFPGTPAGTTAGPATTNGAGGEAPTPAGGGPGAPSAGAATPPAAPDEQGPGAALPDAGPADPGAGGRAQAGSLPPRNGHGRLPASAYVGAEHIGVPHQSLRAGDGCPACEHGSLYRLAKPMVFLRIAGQPPLYAKGWDCEQLRCSGCGTVYTAKPPPEACGPKFTESAAAVIAVLRFFLGTPHYRLDRLQEALGTPVPDATQWDVLFERVPALLPVFRELLRLAAQAPVLHNDDTGVRVLQFLGKRREKLAEQGLLPRPDRTGLYTTGIVAVLPDRPLVVFLTGRRHAGENLAALLELRAKQLASPLLMCDALDRNLPKGHTVEEANCLAHGRRGVVDQAESFPAECRHMLEEIGHVYAVEKACRDEQLAPEDRLLLHQRESQPVMDRLRAWMTAQLQDKRVEPNSELGKAFLYMLKRWDKLTVFLRKPGAPIDNNIVERMLKRAVLHRKNSLFYRSERGAVVGDIYMTLILNAVEAGENPIDYLTALMVHDKAVAAAPADWMPWRYRTTLAALASVRAAANPPLADGTASVGSPSPPPAPATPPTPGDVPPAPSTASAPAKPPPATAPLHMPPASVEEPAVPPSASVPATAERPTIGDASPSPSSPAPSPRAPDGKGPNGDRSSRRRARAKPDLVPPPAFMLFVLLLILAVPPLAHLLDAAPDAHPARLLGTASPPAQIRAPAPATTPPPRVLHLLADTPDTS